MSEKEKARNTHIDYARSHENEYLVQKDLKQLYREEFDEALSTYNVKQKRSDRKIDDYYKHIEWFQGFEMRNPNLKVYNAVIHNDEASPHMHLNFVPVASGYKRGLEKQVSFDRAIIQQDDTLNKERPFDDWREKEVQVKSAELDQHMERIQTTKNELPAIKQIDSRKHVKGVLGSYLKITDKRVELALDDYDNLVKMGRQNVKLRNENRTLSSQSQEVAQKEWEAGRWLANVNERERTLNAREETLTEREKTLNERQKQVETMYAYQSDLNKVLECVESENKALKAENGVLRSSVQKLYPKVEDLLKRLRGAFESLTGVVKAIGILKYSKTDYKANLTKK